MIILPAIDIRGGRCVRLRQGDYKQETVFDADPVAVARRFEAAGAAWLHVVDLDGASAGEPGNLDTIREIVKAVQIPVEMGGGIRTSKILLEVLGAGVSRAILGTRAAADPDWLKRTAEKFRERVALSIDARLASAAGPGGSSASGGPVAGLALRQGQAEARTSGASSFVAPGSRLASDAWKRDSRKNPKKLLDLARSLPLGAIICTSIAKDGMLLGPDVEAMAELVRLYPEARLIASGGVTTEDDVRRLKAVGVAGAIIGRALYEGRITLAIALAASGQHQ